jgi:hypothetical protein
MAYTQKKPEFHKFSGSGHVSRDSLMPQGRTLRIAAVIASAIFLVALAGHGTASGLDVPSTSTVTTPTLDTGSTVGTVTNTVGTVTDTVNNTTNSLPSPTLPSSPSTSTSPTSTVNNTAGTVTDTVKNAPKAVSNTVTKPTSTTSPTAPSSPTSSSGVTNTLSTAVRNLTGSTGTTSGGTGAGGGPGYSGGTTGSGPAGPGLFSAGGGAGGGSAGAAPGGGAPAGSGPLYSAQVTTMRSILDYLAGGSRIGSGVAAAALVQLRESLGLMQGCFYGLSGRERRVLTLRAGLGGRRPHSRSYVADRLNTTPANVRRIEQNALSTLGGLADTTGCASGPGAAAAVADGYISPAELARAPQLVTLANPSYQGAGHSQFSRLGTVPKFAPGLSAPHIDEDSRASGMWALQLLVVMLGLGLIGLVRGGPAIAAWLQVRRERRPAPAVAARSPQPAPRPAHRHAQIQTPLPEGARPARREIQS